MPGELLLPAKLGVGGLKEARWLFVWYDSTAPMGFGQGIARYVVERGPIASDAGVVLRPVQSTWFADRARGTTNALAALESEGIESDQQLAFYEAGDADGKPWFAVGVATKLGSTDPDEVWGIQEMVSQEVRRETAAVEEDVLRALEAAIPHAAQKVWCMYCHRACYRIQGHVSLGSGIATHTYLERRASYCRACDIVLCGGCLAAFVLSRRAKQGQCDASTCPNCGQKVE